MSFRKISDIAADIKARLDASGKFKDLRLSTLTSYEQLLKVIPDISTLPAAVICVGTVEPGNAGATRQVKPGIVVVDSFEADLDSRSAGVWDLADAVADLFAGDPGEPLVINDVIYTVATVEPVALGGSRAAYLVTLTADNSR